VFRSLILLLHHQDTRVNEDHRGLLHE
jgi:hypothetical protein